MSQNFTFPIDTRILFTSGEDCGPMTCHTYRIPALTVTTKGTVLAFCEGRKHGRRDSGDIALLLKRSLDGGQTWQETRVVWDDPEHTCGNPCPVIDASTGTIHLLMTWNRGDDDEAAIIARRSRDTRRVFVTHSTDDGQTWSEPREITVAVKPRNWTWYATGPGAGIQLTRPPFAGRLLVACDHIEADTEARYSHVIFSDDGGQTWQRGSRTPQAGVNECEVVELGDGRLLLNMRNYDRRARSRKHSFSIDGGQTWSNLIDAPALIEPICQASLRAYPAQPGTLLFSNPAHPSERRNLTLRLSADEGQAWPHALNLHPGPAAYSCLAVLPSGDVLCLYEAGLEMPYETLTLARIPAAAIRTLLNQPR